MTAVCGGSGYDVCRTAASQGEAPIAPRWERSARSVYLKESISHARSLECETTHTCRWDGAALSGRRDGAVDGCLIPHRRAVCQQQGSASAGPVCAYDVQVPRCLPQDAAVYHSHPDVCDARPVLWVSFGESLISSFWYFEVNQLKGFARQVVGVHTKTTYVADTEIHT